MTDAGFALGVGERRHRAVAKPDHHHMPQLGAGTRPAPDHDILVVVERIEREIGVLQRIDPAVGPRLERSAAWGVARHRVRADRERRGVDLEDPMRVGRAVSGHASELEIQVAAGRRDRHVPHRELLGCRNIEAAG